MMRRWLSSLLLAAMLLTQHGMLLHGLGHAMVDAQPGFAQATSLQPHPQPADPFCDTCLAFVQIAGAVTAGVSQPLLLDDLGHTLHATPSLPATAAGQPTARSRGPPATA